MFDSEKYLYTLEMVTVEAKQSIRVPVQHTYKHIEMDEWKFPGTIVKQPATSYSGTIAFAC